MNGIFDLSLVKNISLGKRFEFFDHEIMKLALIAIDGLATTGVVYAACVFCREIGMNRERAPASPPGFFFSQINRH